MHEKVFLRLLLIPSLRDATKMVACRLEEEAVGGLKQGNSSDEGSARRYSMGEKVAGWEHQKRLPWA